MLAELGTGYPAENIIGTRDLRESIYTQRRTMWHDFLVAVSLVLVIEGVMPFLSPERTRKTLEMMLQMNNGALRFMGLSSMVLGVILLYILK